MELDLAAAGRALEYLGVVSNSLVTLHAAFVLAFIVTVAGLRRYRRGAWRDPAYASFFGGLTLVLLLSIVFAGLRLALSEWALFVLGALSATLAWTISGAVPIPARRVARSARTLVTAPISAAIFRMRRPRIPDQLPQDLRALTHRG